MISVFTLLSTGLCAMVCCLGGLFFAAWVAKKKAGSFRMFLLGFVTYTLFVLLVQQAILQLLAGWSAYNRLWVRVLLVGMNTALTEVGGRALVCAMFAKEEGSLASGLMLGAGYGWIEALLSVGVTAAYLMGLGAAVYREPEILGQMLDAESAAALIRQLQSLRGDQMLLTCCNRVLTMGLQVAVWVILLAAFVQHRFLPALLAVLLQGGNAAVLELLAGMDASSAAALGCLAVFTALAVWQAVRFSQGLQQKAEPGAGQIWRKPLSRRSL